MNATTVTPLLAVTEVSTNEDIFAPLLVMEVEISRPLPSVEYDERYNGVFFIARLYSEPVGVGIVAVTQEGLTPSGLAALLWPKIRRAVAARYADAGPLPSEFTGEGLKIEASSWPSAQRRFQVLAAPPFISVVICTRDRPEQLKGCLQKVGQVDYPNFEVVVVDNAPGDDTVRAIVKAHSGRPPVCYTVEPRGGLSWAKTQA